MVKQPLINGKVIERAYEEYSRDTYLVNRRYQRKLVWEIDEKKAFVDSLIKGYPVPLFLFSKTKYKVNERFEIIDGMQRLNAVFSFIENDYPTNEGLYFDLSSTALTKSLLDQGKLVQKIPLLDRDISVKLVSYELPYSIYEEENPDVIDDVFKRINANGQHLSNQEIRQAGAINEFAQLVRRIAIKIRGDVSHDEVLYLDKMKTISICKNLNGNGIDPDNVFWVKENIITKEELRRSVDEEIIADIVAGMVLDTIPPSHGTVLDEYYGFAVFESENRYKNIEDAVMKITPEMIEEQFLYVIDEIKNIFSVGEDSIIHHILEKTVNRAPRYFQILFLSLFQILIKKEKKVKNYSDLYKELNNIGERTMKIGGGGGWWPAKQKNEKILATIAVIDCEFSERTEEDPMYYSYSTELENILKQSYTENSQYDFKQGLVDLKTNEFNQTLLIKVFKTLTAMANTEKNAVGYVLLGVADNKKDADKIHQKFGTDAIKVGTFYVTGLNGEVNQNFGGDFDKYFLKVKQELQKMPISEYYMRQIGSKMRHVNYNGKSVIILKIRSDSGAVLFDNGYYTRMGANNDPEPVSAVAMPDFFAKFV